MPAALVAYGDFGAGTTGLVLFIADNLVRIALVVRVIMRRLPVSVAMSWILVLLFLPIIGPLLYLLIGENRLGSRRVLTFERRTRDIEEEAILRWRQKHLDWTADEETYGVLARLSTALGGMPPLRGNALELMDDANLVLDRLRSDIEASQHHCHLLYYIWMPKGRGAEIGEAMIRAASRGVQCRVLVDAVGAKAFLRSDLCAKMRAGGVRIVAALPVNPLRLLFARIDLRNHRKIAVIDGNIAYCGSQNLTDETFTSTKLRVVGPWIDTTVRMTGPAVQALQTVFLRDWAADSDERFGTEAQYFPAPRKTGSSIVHVVPSGPGPRPDAIHQALLTMLFSAKEEILMITPYFVPDEATKAALINAAQRGVSVMLVLPNVLDAPLVAAASRSHYDELLSAGVRILHHPEGLLHAKTSTIDRKLAVVSSANLDMRSFWLNFEITLFIYDDDFASLLRFQQMKYVGESEEIDPLAWQKRPAIQRFVDNTAQLFGPLL
jgi:cardiolipin synthase